MVALTKDRNTAERTGELFSLPMAANAKIYAGSIVMLNATGFATKGATAVGQICAGRADEAVDNTGGADGALPITVRAGVFKFANNGDITAASVGKTVYIVDDQTVAATDGAATRSAAGKVVGVESDGVWVRMGL